MLKVMYFLGIGTALLTACSGNLLGPTATAAPNEVETAVAMGVHQTEEAVFAEQTEEARPTATDDLDVDGTATQAAFIQSLLNQVPQTATAQVEQALPIIEKLLADGYILSTEGIYRKLEDAEESHAVRDWFYWYDAGLSPTNFIWHAVVTFKTNETNTSTIAGCGLAFRKRTNGAGSYVLLDFNGRARYGELGSDFWDAHGINSNVRVNTSFPVEFLLVVQNDGYVFFVDGEEVLSRTGIPDNGNILYLVSAGSVKMECTYEDVWVWSLTN